MNRQEIYAGLVDGTLGAEEAGELMVKAREDEAEKRKENGEEEEPRGIF